MYSNKLQCLLIKWPRTYFVCWHSSTIEGQKLPQTSKSSDGISPPPRVHRGPTDILQALASTVGTDPTAAKYKYHDDPYLIPGSNYQKRAYALSAEAGRKAAVWIRDQHAELFTTRVWDPPGRKRTPHFNADPHIDAFKPKPIYTDESKVTAEDLKYTIENALIEDSGKVFELLGGEVSNELKLSLLQLLCFYNEKEPDSVDWPEERWFKANREHQASTWKLGGQADTIFKSMNPKSPEAYCAMIQGMAKYCQAGRAHALLKEAKENGIQLSTGVYNSLLARVGYMEETLTLRLELIRSLLEEMEQEGLSPNQETLMACLESLSVWGRSEIVQKFAIQLLAEFREIGIQPNLAAYHYLLCMFCKERGPRVDILSGILDELEKRGTLIPTSTMDTYFFLTAMAVCSNHLKNFDLAERLHNLLMKDDNYKLVGDAYKESIYYRHYLTAACRNAPIEKTLEIMDILIPNIYTPEPSTMVEIIKMLELAGNGSRLAQAWSQLVLFGYSTRIDLVTKLFDAICNCYEFQDNEVKALLRAAAAEVLKIDRLAEEQQEFRRTPTQSISSTLVCNLLALCADANDTDNAIWESVSDGLERLHKALTDEPENTQLLANFAIKVAKIGKYEYATSAIMYMSKIYSIETIPACVQIFSNILNRTTEEVEKLLDEPKDALSTKLHPSLLDILDVYKSLKTSKYQESNKSSESSDSSDSSSSSDDE